MQVRRAERLAAQRGQKRAHRAVLLDRIERRLHPAKPVFPRVIGAKRPAQVEIRLDAILLHVVKPFVFGLPDVDLGPRDRRTIGAKDATLHKNWLTLLIQTNI